MSIDRVLAGVDAARRVGWAKYYSAVHDARAWESCAANWRISYQLLRFDTDIAKHLLASGYPDLALRVLRESTEFTYPAPPSGPAGETDPLEAAARIVDVVHEQRERPDRLDDCWWVR